MSGWATRPRRRRPTIARWRCGRTTATRAADWRVPADAIFRLFGQNGVEHRLHAGEHVVGHRRALALGRRQDGVGAQVEWRLQHRDRNIGLAVSRFESWTLAWASAA